MSIAVRHVEGPDDGVVLVHVQPRCDTSGLAALVRLWSVLEARIDARAVAVLGDDHFSVAADLDIGRAEPSLIGPKHHGLRKPFGVALRGDVFDFGLQLVADADVVIASCDVLFADSSVARGQTAEHASILDAVLPAGETNRLALLGVQGAMTAHRAADVGLVTSVVRIHDLVPTLTDRLRHLTHVG